MRTLHTNFLWGESGQRQEMLVEEGRVVERGVAVSGPCGERIDHQGKQLFPAFVDAHCHILPTGLDLLKLHLGLAKGHRDVLDLLSARHREQAEGWLMAVHYDHNLYAEGHLSREQLDAISPTRPILLKHSSGHAGVANSAALQAAGIDDSFVNAESGYLGNASGRLSGVLLELAWERAAEALPALTLDEMVAAILAAGKSMREFGIACASDMQTGRFDLAMELEAYGLAARHGCEVATRLYIQWSKVFGRRAMSQPAFHSLQEGLKATEDTSNSCRVAGVKLFADGAIGASTAAIYGSYAGGASAETSGTLIYKPEKLAEMVATAAAEGYQVCVHSIGDHSTDVVMDAIAKTEEPAKHRIEHAMLLSDAQIERLANLGCFVSVQPEFLHRFGRTYRQQLGPERASKLIRTRSLIDAGIPLSFSSDRPITSGDPWIAMDAASHRPEGFSPEENCTAEEALAAHTVRGSEVNGDGRQFGTLDVGSWAEFRV